MSNNPKKYRTLDEKLEQIINSRSQRQLALKSQDKLLSSAARLASAEHPRLSDAARRRIMARVQSASANASTSMMPAWSGWFSTLAAVFAVFILSGFLTVAASASSLPGSFLYPLKRSVENVQLTFASAPAQQVEIHLSHAQTRLNEINAINGDAEDFSDLLASAMDSLEAATSLAQDADSSDNNALENARQISERLNEVLTRTPSDVDLVELTGRLTVIEDTLQTLTVIEPDDVPPVEITPEPDITVEVTEPAETPEILDIEEDVVSVEPFKMYIVPDGRVNLHEGPSVAEDIMGTGNQNTPVTVLSITSDGLWAEVELPNGQTGWLQISELDETPGRSGGNGGESNSAGDNASSNSRGNSNGNSGANRNDGNNGNNSNNSNNQGNNNSNNSNNQGNNSNNSNNQGGNNSNNSGNAGGRDK